MKLVLSAAALLLLAAASRAAVHTETVTYKYDDTVCEGYLAYDDAQPGKRPGVLVVHEWLGLNDYAKKRARCWPNWVTSPSPATCTARASAARARGRAEAVGPVQGRSPS